MVAFHTIIKGMHPFPRNMLINATFGLWISLSSPMYRLLAFTITKVKGLQTAWEISLLLLLHQFSGHAGFTFFLCLET